MTSLDKTLDERMAEGQALVYSLATKIYRNLPVRVDLDDLIAYGHVGLAEVAREFDPSRGVQFTTFAYYRIRGAIYDGVSKMSWTSRARISRLRFLQRANEALEEQNRQYPSHPDASLSDDAAWLASATERLAIVYLASQREGEDEGANRLLDAPARETPNEIEVREISARLNALVESLPLDQRRLIRTIYFEGLTLTEAAEQLGISKSWASRMHARTLDELARALRRIGAD